MNDQLQFVINPYNNPTSENRPGAILIGNWKTEYCKTLLKKKITALYLNVAQGWQGTDLSFLKDLDMIEELQIIAPQTENLAAIENMKALQQLSITTNTRETIDFNKLEKLRSCYLYWWNNTKSVFECRNLESVYFDKLKLKDYSIITHLSKLKSLTIANCPITATDWIHELAQLNQLSLYNCKKIPTFNPISQLKNLNRLEISGYRNLGSIDFLRNLTELEILLLTDVGEITNLSPFESLTQLKAFCFAGAKTRVSDGNLSVLETLPRLAMLMFRPWKHYTHKLIKKWNWKNLNTPDRLLEKSR